MISKQTRVRRNNKIKKVVKIVLRDIIAIIVALVYLVNLLFSSINKVVRYYYNRLPRVTRTIVIYLLLIMATFGGYSAIKGEEIRTIVEEKIVTVEVEKEVAVAAEETPKEVNPYNLTSINEKNIYNKALELGLDDNQAIIVVSISRHETGNWKSKYFKEYNNFGGVMTSKGIRKYNSYEEGLTHYVNVLKKGYFNKGLNTIKLIGAKYCPVGAENDPKGLNKNWISGVTKLYNSYVNNTK